MSRTQVQKTTEMEAMKSSSSLEDTLQQGSQTTQPQGKYCHECGETTHETKHCRKKFKRIKKARQNKRKQLEQLKKDNKIKIQQELLNLVQQQSISTKETFSNLIAGISSSVENQLVKQFKKLGNIIEKLLEKHQKIENEEKIKPCDYCRTQTKLKDFEEDLGSICPHNICLPCSQLQVLKDGQLCPYCVLLKKETKSHFWNEEKEKMKEGKKQKQIDFILLEKGMKESLNSKNPEIKSTSLPSSLPYSSSLSSSTSKSNSSSPQQNRLETSTKSEKLSPPKQENTSPIPPQTAVKRINSASQQDVKKQFLKDLHHFESKDLIIVQNPQKTHQNNPSNSRTSTIQFPAKNNQLETSRQLPKVESLKKDMNKATENFQILPVVTYEKLQQNQILNQNLPNQIVPQIFQKSDNYGQTGDGEKFQRSDNHGQTGNGQNQSIFVPQTIEDLQKFCHFRLSYYENRLFWICNCQHWNVDCFCSNCNQGLIWHCYRCNTLGNFSTTCVNCGEYTILAKIFN